MKINGYTSYNSAAEIVKSQQNAASEKDKKNVITTVKKVNSQDALKKQYDDMSSMKSDLVRMSREREDEARKLKMMTTCMKISQRMMSGDSVPAADKNYLRKNDPSLYARSIMFRYPKLKPFKYKRLSNDDEKNGDTSACLASGAAGADTQSNLKDITNEIALKNLENIE